MKTSDVLLQYLLFAAIVFFSASPVFAQQDSLQNTVSVSYEQTHFSQQYPKDWRMTSVEYKRRLLWGTLVGRVNHASRLGHSGVQLEGEAYPVISKRLYAYTGLSYSAAVPVFPRWRTGVTLYGAFAKGWEAEGGFRYLYFEQPVWMGTAGISKYVGAWLFNARTFFSLQTPSKNQSFFVRAQRFLPNEKDYLWLQAGSGVSPDESRNVQLGTVAALQSKRLAAGAKFSLTSKMHCLLSAGYARDEYRTKTFGHQYSGSAGLGYRF